MARAKVNPKGPKGTVGSSQKHALQHLVGIARSKHWYESQRGSSVQPKQHDMRGAWLSKQ